MFWIFRKMILDWSRASFGVYIAWFHKTTIGARALTGAVTVYPKENEKTFSWHWSVPTVTHFHQMIHLIDCTMSYHSHIFVNHFRAEPFRLVKAMNIVLATFIWTWARDDTFEFILCAAQSFCRLRTFQIWCRKIEFSNENQDNKMIWSKKGNGGGGANRFRGAWK